MATPKKTGVIDAITHRIPSTEDITLLPLSDLHIGDRNANIEHIKHLINEIQNHENYFTFLVGDLMNSGIVGSKSDIYSETMTPHEQLETCIDILRPISDRILAVVPGNHEERISRVAGVDMTRMMCDRLSISDRYDPAAALVILRVGQDKKYGRTERPVFYSFYLCHGHGGGRRPGGKLNGLADFASIIDADVIIQGHTHTPIIYRQSHLRISPQNANATPHEQVLVNLPSSVDYGGYGKRGGYQPPSQKYPKIVLCHDEHRIDVIM